MNLKHKNGVFNYLYQITKLRHIYIYIYIYNKMKQSHDEEIHGICYWIYIRIKIYINNIY